MKKRQFLDQRKYMSQGFTLVELIIALVISLVVMSGIYAYSNSHHKSHIIQTRVNEMNQGIRVSINKMVTEIRMAGYKTGSDTSDIMTQTAAWTNGLVPSLPYAVVMDDNLVIIDGTTNPVDDMISFIYGETTPTTLAVGAPAGSTVITVLLTGTETARKFSVGDIIYIGYGTIQPENLEFAKIVSIGGSQLFIDTDATTPTVNDPLQLTHRIYTEVGLMNVVTYAIFNDDNDPSCLEHTKGCPVLKRKCNGSPMEKLVENIESLDIQDIGNDDIRINIMARTSKADPEYTNPDFGDHYRRRTLNTVIQIRNR
ncbi:MAG: prepilin-type N-terminal cleavage/methylation domain-containing protein [bacterium]